MQAEDQLSVVIVTDRFDEKLSDCLRSLPNRWPIIICAAGVKPPTSFRTQYPQLSIVELSRVTNFSHTRNQCLKLVKTEWVLFLDSDEVLYSIDKKAFQQLLKTTPHSGLTVSRSDFFQGKRLRHGEAGEQQLVRLMKPQSATFVGAVHEVAQIQGSVGDSKLVLLHYSHDSITQFVTQVVVYARRAAQERTYDGMQTWLELLLFPPSKFIWNFGIKLGFLDGWRGLVYAVVMSLHSTCVRLFLIENHITQQKQRDTLG